MNKADSDRIQQLCSLIAVEQNHQKFLTMVEELNRVLSRKKDDSSERNKPAEQKNG